MPGDEAIYIGIENLITRFAEHLFPGFEMCGSGVFRVLRDSDIEIEEEAEDLVREFEALLKQRRRGVLVRLKIEAGMPEELRRFITQQLHAEKQDVQLVDGLLGMAQLGQMIPDERPELKFDPYEPRFPERIKDHGGDVFAAVRAKDLIVHHPYESFDVVVEFLRQAARDPDVITIKQTLYRAGKQSAIINALIAAAEAGNCVRNSSGGNATGVRSAKRGCARRDLSDFSQREFVLSPSP